MGRAARPFTFTLLPTEASEVLEPTGEGGHQKLHDQLCAQLSNGNLTIELDDAQLGKVFRYMTQYGSGGFQGRLSKAFRRPLLELLDRR